MQTTRFLSALALCSLFPTSLTAQSVTPVPIPQPMPVPHPVINISQLLPVEIHVPSIFPVSVNDSDRDLPVQEQETIQKSFSMSGIQHKSLEIDNVWGSI